jgi:cytochrome b6-f complex iron-sulfur subunit
LEPEKQNLSRRRFIDILLGTGLAATAVAILYPIIDYILPPKVPEAALSSVVAAKKGELAPNSAKVFKFGSKPGILILTPQGEYRSFSATCTHLACTVQYRPDLGHIWCACHNGHYDLTGRNIAGPPPRPLEQYKVDLRGEEIVVSKG